MAEPTQAMVSFRDPALEDISSLARVFVQSGWFKDTRALSQGITKILSGRELGFGPIASMSGVYIVEGKPALSANLIAAAVKRSGKYNYRIREHSATCCRIEFFEQGESVGCSEFTWKDAEAAKVAHKATWQQYPRNMLFARAMSNGARWYCADIFAGSTPYTPEELGHDEQVDATGATVLCLPTEPTVVEIVREPAEPEPHYDAPEDDTDEPFVWHDALNPMTPQQFQAACEQEMQLTRADLKRKFPGTVNAYLQTHRITLAQLCYALAREINGDGPPIPPQRAEVA